MGMQQTEGMDKKMEYSIKLFDINELKRNIGG